MRRRFTPRQGPAQTMGLTTRALAVSLLMLSSASAHDWYPLEFCSKKDCSMVPAGAVKRTSKGWLLPSGHTIPFGDYRVKPLPPGKVGVHVCETQDKDRRPLCLFVGEDQL